MGRLGILSAVFDKAMLKEAAIVAGGGAAAAVAYDLVNEIDLDGRPLFDRAWKKLALAAGLALAPGVLLWKKGGQSREFVKGAMGAMGGEIARQTLALVRGFAAGAAGGATEAGAPTTPEAKPIKGYVHGLGASQQVIEERRIGGQQILSSALEVEEQSGIGAWYGG